MSSSLNDEIAKQEEDIFQELGSYDFQNELPFHKNKARQQLAVSADSPFSNLGADNAEAQLRRLKEERAAILKNETNEIRRQLDLVKSRLNDLKVPKGTSNMEKSNLSYVNKSNSQEKELKHGSSWSGNNEKSAVRSPPSTIKIKKYPEAKFRPLTGKADCPNCACDRRSSVCNQCISMSTIQRPKIGKKISSPPNNRPKWFTSEDDRPIRPAQRDTRTLATTAGVEVIDEKVVPGKVYTISKSLNEKRTKLAQAIDDLESIMEQVKDKGDKLDNERKVVQLYKDQWKYGPSIGGPGASSRERLGLAQQNRNYESRLDPSLARDYKSLSGYNHIESGMKLRQYGPPKRSLAKQVVHSRSKSLESLKPAVKTNINLQKAIENFHTGKASSEVDLSSKVTKATNNEPKNDNDEDGDDGDEGEGYEKEIDEVRVDESADVQSVPGSPEGSVIVDNNPETLVSEDNGDKKVRRMSWIPVFGETEIKTIKRDTKRKVQVVKSDNVKLKQNNSKPSTVGSRRHVVIHSTPSKSPQLANESTCSSREKVSNKGGGGRVMAEAARKLRFASDLLEQEQTDSRTKNQLTVNKTKPVPSPRRILSPCVQNHQTETSESMTAKEISRLEEMVNEQQRLLSRLVQSQDRCHLVSPTLASCTSPCSCHQNCTSSPVHRNQTSHKALIGTLRDRLNKTKTRLARTLEAEREKHQQLKLKVDSSLRKQSNLETENELLKQSLSKCIDTCLKDISNTFESLSDTLNDSICKQSEEDDAHSRSVEAGDGGGGSSTVGLSNAAQLIADNRHLQQMKSHIETIERQRRRIFEELAREKQKSNQLELQLKESQSELNELMETKHRVETRLTHAKTNEIATTDTITLSNNHKAPTTTCQPSTSKQQTPLEDSTGTETTTTDLDDTTFSSVDVYRRYIQSMSPDIEAIRRERKMILSEFDNIKKMLSDIDS